MFPANHPVTNKLIGPLTNLLNTILELGGISKDRLHFVDAHNISVQYNHRLPITPSILLFGAGSEFATLRDASCLSRIPGANSQEARDRLTVFAYKLFHCVPNRRFVYGLVITQRTVITRIYDCAWGVLSNPLPYLTMSDSFVSLILGLASDGQRMGLDRTICRRLEDNTLS